VRRLANTGLVAEQCNVPEALRAYGGSLVIINRLAKANAGVNSIERFGSLANCCSLKNGLA
jgi:hypothetical protein